MVENTKNICSLKVKTKKIILNVKALNKCWLAIFDVAKATGNFISDEACRPKKVEFTPPIPVSYDPNMYQAAGLPLPSAPQTNNNMQEQSDFGISDF